MKGIGYLKGGVFHGLKGIYKPLDAGSASMALSGSTLLVDLPRLMYGISGVHHQSNLVFEVNTSTMSTKTRDELEGDYVYSSHVFNGSP